MHNLYRLANIVGLDTENTQHTVALKEAMHGVEDQEDFLEYCRANKASIKTFGKGEKPERLDTLSTQYKKLQEDKLLESKYSRAEEYADVLSEMVKLSRDYVETKCVDFDMIKMDGKKFKDHQIRCLRSIGSTIAIIEYSRVGTLKGKIIAEYKKNVKIKYNVDKQALTSNQKKVMQLASGVTK